MRNKKVKKILNYLHNFAKSKLYIYLLVGVYIAGVGIDLIKKMLSEKSGTVGMIALGGLIAIAGVVLAVIVALELVYCEYSELADKYKKEIAAGEEAMNLPKINKFDRLILSIFKITIE